MNLNFEKIKEISEECNFLLDEIKKSEEEIEKNKNMIIRDKDSLKQKEKELFGLLNPNIENQCMETELKERLKVYEDKINELEEELKPYRLLKSMDDKKKRGRPRKNESEID